MSVNKVNSDGSLSRVASGTLYADAPIGTISPFGGSAIPSGYLLCNGAEVLKTTYAELYAVIGDAFGTASDNTKFKLPDLRGEFLRGAGTNSHTGEGSGGDVGVHQGATQVPLITLRQNDITTANFNNQITNNTVENADYNTLLQTANGVGIDYSLSGTVYSTSLDSIRYTTRPTNTSVNYIIKAKQVAVPADFAPVDVIENSNMKAVTSNAVYDEFKKIQPQTYECSGFLVNSLAGEITGYGRATVTLRDGIAEIKFSVRIHTNDGPATFNWGLNRDLLHTLIPDLPTITPIGNYSNLQFFAGTGDVLIDLMGYGAMASSSNQFWVPARMYQIDGSTGTWGTDRFPINSYITGTVYGVYTV